MQKKTVFVTGGSRGIGRAIANWFIKRDYNVIIGFYKNFEYKKSPLREKNVFSAMVDIKNRKSIIDAINISENYFKTTIDVLINNAAISQEKDFTKISDKDWDIMLATNLRGVFSFTQEVIPKMIKKRWGRIINISSVGGQWGGFNQVHYAASKAGVINFTKSIAKIYSEYGITCNCVSPGLIRTDMSNREIDSDQGIEKISTTPIKRIGEADEVASAVGFLSKHSSSYVTGQTINVNGGMYFS